MRIALIQTPYQHRVFETISIPLGLCWISAVLKEKFPGVLIDGYDLLFSPDDEETLYDNVKTLRYDFVGIQIHSDMTINNAIRIFKKLKLIDPDILLIAGGNAATFMASYLFEHAPVDIIVKGEGELTMVDIIYAKNNAKSYEHISGIFYNNNNTIFETKDRPMICDLDLLPLPDRSIFNHYNYPQYSIIMSRGCPYSCSFCSTSKFWGHRVRMRSADSVANEIKELKDIYLVKKIFVLDDTFGCNHKVALEYLKVLTNAKVEWACTTRSDVVNEYILELCKKAGCVEIHFGLDTANIKTQELINKKLDINQLKKMCTYIKSIGIRLKLSIIIGFPNETREDVFNTINLLSEIIPNEIQVYPLMPYEGIDIIKNSNQIKVIEKSTDKWKQDALNPVIETNLLSQNDIIDITKELVELFRLKGYKWIPFDMPPEKRNELYIIKTEFAPLQAL